MPKFDGMFRKDSPGGQRAFDSLQTLKQGEVFEELLMPAIPRNVRWTCVEVKDNYWRIEGEFCGIPLYTVEVIGSDTSLGIKVREIE